MTALQQHIAAHLIRIALFSLPHSTGADGHTESGTSWSGRANGHHSDSSQVASGESSSSSSQSGNEMKSPRNERSRETLGLSQNALRQLETITSGQGTNAKVEQFLSHLNESDLEDQSSNRNFLSAPKLAGMEEDEQSLVAYEASSKSHDMASPAKESTEGIYTGRRRRSQSLDDLAAELADLRERWTEEIRARGHASAQDRLSNFESTSEAKQQDSQGVGVPQQEFNETPLPAPEIEEGPMYCHYCGEELTGTAIEATQMSQRWHRHCFKCIECETALELDGGLMTKPDGNLICDQCTYTCTACGKKIDDIAFLTGDQAFCSACFKCYNCKRKIENLRHASTPQGILCMDCHEALTARRPRKETPEQRQQSGKIIEEPLVPVTTDLRRQAIGADDKEDLTDLAQPHPSSLSPTASSQHPAPSAPTAGPSTMADEERSIQSLSSSDSTKAAIMAPPSATAGSTSSTSRDTAIPSQELPREKKSKDSVSSVFRISRPPLSEYQAPRVARPQATSGRPSVQQGRQAPGVLIKNNRKFIDPYDQEQGPTPHSGTSGVVKKIQDFFRRRRPSTDGDDPHEEMK
ncbi:uncharacterized protein PV07_01859 [Cladophialophora immunda]|uniref:LIM zinc-binding domain-containing protein n=1 Tax=Cladophialophora immunda TaxID=569365 RepID=A0A0D2DHB1_9EURO|nr:uncharacterized protein PV07_01859 [Cladophialophora immunda]KIW35144.1 hypothetical protein PV07_01859 [Cladophialophora immunda]